MYISIFSDEFYKDIYEAQKKQVGDRFAYLALANDYGFKEIDASAPMPKKFAFENGFQLR